MLNATRTTGKLACNAKYLLYSLSDKSILVSVIAIKATLIPPGNAINVQLVAWHVRWLINVSVAPVTLRL